MPLALRKNLKKDKNCGGGSCSHSFVQRRESRAACIFFTSIFHVRYGNTISTLEYADCITLNGLWNEVLAPFLFQKIEVYVALIHNFRI